jgi:hypothetical protein
MNKATCILRGVALACALCAAGTPAMAAKDPARWTQGDSTKTQRMATLKKEINAAYAEQQSACKRKASARRDACLTQARQIYQRDLANAPRLLAQAPRGRVTERVVSTTPAAPAATTQPGATAYGNSGAGTTGSGGATGTVSGKDDALPPSSGQTGGLPPPRIEPQSGTPPVQQQ